MARDLEREFMIELLKNRADPHHTQRFPSFIVRVITFSACFQS
jgi:hypothetical protein